MSLLYVGIGGVLGALVRYQISKWIAERVVVSFPLATLLINVTGSLLLGLFTHQLGLWFPLYHTETNLLLGVGFCGAYTTFSTFSYEFIILFREARYRTAWLYASSSVVLGFMASAIGLYGFPSVY